MAVDTARLAAWACGADYFERWLAERPKEDCPVKTRALAPWFGSNRMLASAVGAALAGCKWVGVPFAGGMAEVAEMDALTILVNDLHRHVINLARVTKSDELRPRLIRRLRRDLVHPDELAAAQRLCTESEPGDRPDLDLAEAYFVCCWAAGRRRRGSTTSSAAGRPSGGTPAAGTRPCGTGAVRGPWPRGAGPSAGARSRRWTASTSWQAVRGCRRPRRLRRPAVPRGRPPVPAQLPARPTTRSGHGTSGSATSLGRFGRTRVVCRFYDHPLVRELYPPGVWFWQHLAGGKTQARTKAPEVLIGNKPFPDDAAPPAGELFIDTDE
jgi:DNA adenine methylase